MKALFMHKNNKTNFRALLSLTIFSLILLVSSFLYSYTKIFWIFELPPFIFTAIVALFSVFIIFQFNGSLFLFSINDLTIVFFFFYIFISSQIVSSAEVVSDRIYFVTGYFIFFLLVKQLFTFIKPEWVISVLFALSLVQALLGCLQYLQLLPFSFNKVTGIRGTLFYSNVYGCLMAIGICINVYLIPRTNEKRWKLLLYALFFIFLMPLLLSLSRTALLAAVSGAGLIIISNLSLSRKMLKTGSVLLTSLLFLSISAFLLFLNIKSVIGRLIIWKISFSMFLTHPFLGSGFGTFFTQYGNYQADFFLARNASGNLANIAGMNYQPFSEIVRIVIENGIIGLLLALVVFVLIIRTLLRSSVETIWIAILVIVMIFCLVSYPFTDITITAIFISTLCAINKKERVFLTIKLNPLKSLFVVLLLTTAAALSIQKIQAIIKWGEYQNALRYRSGDNITYYQKIYPVLSNNGSFLFNYGAELAAIGQSKESLKVLKRASNYCTNIELYTELGNNYFLNKDYAKAEFCFLRAAYMVPKKFVPINNLLEFYRNTSQNKKARQIAKKICEQPVKVPSLIVDQIKSKACTFLKTQEFYEN